MITGSDSPLGTKRKEPSSSASDDGDMPAPPKPQGPRDASLSSLASLCHFTRNELREVLEKRIRLPELYHDYFFKSTVQHEDTPHLMKRFKIPKDDLNHHCRTCGCTIDKHNLSQQHYIRKGLSQVNPNDTSTDSAQVDRAEELVQFLNAANRNSASVTSFDGDLINGALIERDDTFMEVTTFMCELLDASVAETTGNIKAKFPIACTVSGSGGGKTTLCLLIEGPWRDTIRNDLNAYIEGASGALRNATPIRKLSVAFATFNSSCGCDETEASSLTCDASLGIRLLASRHGWSHVDTREFIKNDDAVSPYKSLKLGACLRQLKVEKDEALIILIDEILRLTDEAALQSILLRLSNFQQECLQQSVKVFVLVTSLSSTPPATLTQESTRGVTPISLPPISPAEVLRQARHYTASLKVKTSRTITKAIEHHIISEFCATGGLVKFMKRVERFFDNELNHLEGFPLPIIPNDYQWAKKVLSWSVFEEEASSTLMVGSEATLQTLINDHLVTVEKTTTTGGDVVHIRIRIPPHILRSIPRSRDGSLTLTQRQHLEDIMASLKETTRDYSKTFEVALLRVLCLRLSLMEMPTSLSELLPGHSAHTMSNMPVLPSQCDWVRIGKMTKTEVRRKRKHGTMVFSEKSNEPAVEAFWYLQKPDGKPFLLFMQMKFWKSCSASKIEQWEKEIQCRVEKEFGVASHSYAPLFFSTSQQFGCSSSSISMCKPQVEKLLAPFGICPMMLYAQERLEMATAN